MLSINSSAQTSKFDLYKQTSEVNNTMIQYEADKGSVIRFYSVVSNAYTYGTRFEKDNYNTPERRERLLKLIAEYQISLKELDFDSMNINGQVDYILFNQSLNNEKTELVQQQKKYDKIKTYFPFEEKIYAIEKPRLRGMKVNGEVVAKEMNLLCKVIKEQMKILDKVTGLDKESSSFAVMHTKALQSILKKYYDFYNGYDPLFTWWVPKTYEELDSLLVDYATLLKSKETVTSTQKDDGSGIVGNPIGRDELIRQLETEFIPYTPEELVKIANKEFAWCDAELLKASKEMGFGDDWKSAQEKVKNSFVAPGEQPQAMFDLYTQSVDF